MAKSPKKPAATPAESSSTAPTTTKKLERHALSEMFSLPSSEEERLGLATHMSENGQIHDILLYEGMVLDGWERYMGCLQKGLTPTFKQYTGPNPAAVAFGVNAIRRKLSSVQKALLGAKYFIHAQSSGEKVTQQGVAKMSSVSLQRLNELVQLLRAVDHNAEAARCAATLNTNPDVTTATLQQMLSDCGIIDAQARVSTRARDTSTDNELDDALGEDDDSSVDESVDDLLGGGDIDDLIDSADEASAGKAKKVTSAEDMPRISNSTSSIKRPKQTPASAAAQTFKALTEPERLDFVKFAWSMLRPAVEAYVNQGRIEWEMLGAHKDSSKAAMADMTNALAKASISAKAVEEPKASKGAAKGKAKKVDAIAVEVTTPKPAPAARNRPGAAKPTGAVAKAKKAAAAVL